MYVSIHVSKLTLVYAKGYQILLHTPVGRS